MVDRGFTPNAQKRETFGSYAVCRTPSLHAEAASDRKLQALRPLWEGLSQVSPPEPQTYEAHLKAWAPMAEAVIRWATNRAYLAHFCESEAFTLPPVLLVGPNGVGKTSLAQKMASAAGLTPHILSVSGKNDPRTLLGTSPGYATGHPALAAQIMARAGQSNPVIILDEIDKHAVDPTRGSWVDGLLPFLENATSEHLYDEFLGAEIDFSGISWILTANSTESLPDGLLDRLTCFELRTFVGQNTPSTDAMSSEDAVSILAKRLKLPHAAIHSVFGARDLRIEHPVNLSPRQTRLALVDSFAEHLRTKTNGC